MAWAWRDSAVVRVLGSFVSWAGFVLCFSLLYRVSYAVLALGGSCASGGPYAIEVECPAAVALFAPLSIFGGLLFGGVWFLFAQGFGTPLLVWAWPILFVGLSVPFFVSAVTGSISGIVVGLLFLVMGVAPVWLLLRQPDPWLLFLGGRNAGGRSFAAAGEGPTTRLIGRRPGAVTDPVAPTVADWMLSLGVLGISVASGVVGAQALWDLAS
jgi:hypothetical protein